MNLQQTLQELTKAISAGSYNAAPDALRQGPSLGIEDVSPMYYNQSYEEKHIFLQKDVQIRKAKSTTVQFIRRLSYGRFGGSAQLEGAVGRERTSDWTRVQVPMCYYSEIRRVTVPSMMIETQGGDKVEDLEAEGGQLNLAGDIEFDMFRGCDDFSNNGVFDGNPNVIPALANIRGFQLQIRQADSQQIANDLMFLAYGAGLSSTVQVGGVLTQDSIEDMSVRSSMNKGNADVLLVDPLVHSQYNKLAFSRERINLAGGPVEQTGADLRRQSTHNGVVEVKSSQFLSGKFRPHLPADGAPGAPTIAVADASGTTAFLAGQVYQYYVTAENENGEGAASATTGFTVTANARQIQVTITPGSGTSRFFNVYRSGNGGTSAGARFIGRVVNSGAATTVFYDLGNKIPGFVTACLVQYDTMFIGELAPYSRMKLAVSDLSVPEAHFRFCTLGVGSPKKNVLGENLRGGH